jgi:hypothetical protein
MLQQRGFANTRLPTQEQHLTRASLGNGPNFEDVAYDAMPSNDLHATRCRPRLLMGGSRRFGDKPVASAMKCLDKQRPSRVVTERLTQFLDTGRQCGVAHRCIRPNCAKKLFFCD